MKNDFLYMMGILTLICVFVTHICDHVAFGSCNEAETKSDCSITNMIDVINISNILERLEHETITNYYYSNQSINSWNKHGEADLYVQLHEAVNTIICRNFNINGHWDKFVDCCCGNDDITFRVSVDCTGTFRSVSYQIVCKNADIRLGQSKAVNPLKRSFTCGGFTTTS